LQGALVTGIAPVQIARELSQDVLRTAAVPLDDTSDVCQWQVHISQRADQSPERNLVIPVIAIPAARMDARRLKDSLLVVQA